MYISEVWHIPYSTKFFRSLISTVHKNISLKIFDTQRAMCICSEFTKLFQRNLQKLLFVKIWTLENLALYSISLCNSGDIRTKMKYNMQWSVPKFEKFKWKENNIKTHICLPMFIIFLSLNNNVVPREWEINSKEFHDPAGIQTQDLLNTSQTFLPLNYFDLLAEEWTSFENSITKSLDWIPTDSYWTKL